MSEALRLADCIDFPSVHCGHKAAAELRRLCAELERKSDAIQRLWKERDELRTLNAELVEALRLISATFDDSWMEDSVERVMGDKARAALAKVEASK